MRTVFQTLRLIVVALVSLLLEASGASLTLSDDLNRAAVEIGVEGSQDTAKAKRLEWFLVAFRDNLWLKQLQQDEDARRR
jgi:hypothetical protein